MNSLARRCRFLRNNDRARNTSVYPNLYYPEMYLLEGGYKEFFTNHSVSGCLGLESMLISLSVHPFHRHCVNHKNTYQCTPKSMKMIWKSSVLWSKAIVTDPSVPPSNVLFVCNLNILCTYSIRLDLRPTLPSLDQSCNLSTNNDRFHFVFIHFPLYRLLHLSCFFLFRVCLALSY